MTKVKCGYYKIYLLDGGEIQTGRMIELNEKDYMVTAGFNYLKKKFGLFHFCQPKISHQY